MHKQISSVIDLVNTTQPDYLVKVYSWLSTSSIGSVARWMEDQTIRGVASLKSRIYLNT